MKKFNNLSLDEYLNLLYDILEDNNQNIKDCKKLLNELKYNFCKKRTVFEKIKNILFVKFRMTK